MTWMFKHVLYVQYSTFTMYLSTSSHLYWFLYSASGGTGYLWHWFHANADLLILNLKAFACAVGQAPTCTYTTIISWLKSSQQERLLSFVSCTSFQNGASAYDFYHRTHPLQIKKPLTASRYMFPGHGGLSPQSNVKLEGFVGGRQWCVPDSSAWIQVSDHTSRRCPNTARAPKQNANNRYMYWKLYGAWKQNQLGI